MKKGFLFVIFVVLVLFFFSACSSEPEVVPPKNCVGYDHGESWNSDDDCNSCSCSDGVISCTEYICESEVENNTISINGNFSEILFDLSFNVNLTQAEIRWLKHLEGKNPNSKVFHVKTEDLGCKDCYEAFYKIDRNIYKIKVLDSKKISEIKVGAGVFVEIKDENTCLLFQGEWDECPLNAFSDGSVWNDNCGKPVCILDEDRVIYKQIDEVCGYQIGDCDMGLTCYYKDVNQTSGLCKKN